MPSNLDYIHKLLKQHYEEASEGLVDKPPSGLCRGEGTEKNFYILKIDLVNSTFLLHGRHKSTYLKFAHTFLSTIDKITQDFGADPTQTEYAGDSVLAYFPESKASAEDVLTAACYSSAAVRGMQKLDGTLGGIRFRCKVVLHFDSLIVSKIGPRSESILTAIGLPLHRITKIEKDIQPGTGRATPNFYKKVVIANRKFLMPIYDERNAPVPIYAQPPSPVVNGLLGLRATLAPESLFPLHRILNDLPPYSQPVQQHIIEKTLIGYDLKWIPLFHKFEILK